jgi:hypothetical protein
MMSDSSRVLPSIPAGPGLMPAVLRLLDFIDELPSGATGALRFGDFGLILLQARKICWAVAQPMRLRLTDLLRNQSTPPLPREAVEEVYRKCKDSGHPLGEALVASGLVSEAGLRSALFKHNGEAIAHLARAYATPDSFTGHTGTGYDPAFSFSSCEVLAMLGALDDPGRAIAAQFELANTLVSECSGAAFARSNAVGGPLVIAVDRSCDVPVNDLIEICTWVTGLFDVARTFDPRACAARANWGGTALVTWQVKEVGYVGLCASRPAAARLFSQLCQRALANGGFEADPGERST